MKFLRSKFTNRRMADHQKQTLLIAILLVTLGHSRLHGDPSHASLLSPVFALSARSGATDHMVNPFEIAAVAPQAAAGDAFASGEIDSEVEQEAAETVGGGYAFASDETLTEAGSVASSFRDQQDSLIRSEQESYVDTFANDGAQRLPESWAVPPGGSVPGGHPGTQHSPTSLDYSDQSEGVSYFPPPSLDTARSSAYGYPTTYSPAGPYAYQYNGMDPMGDPSYFGDASYEFDGDIPLFTRDFNPDEAHLKVGPFYFQALWIGAGILYSDYNGNATFRPGEEDGWLSYANFRFRMAAELTPSLYVTMNGEVIYLFGENQLGFRTGLSGRPFAEITYEGQSGAWDYRLYALFGTGSVTDLFGEDAYDRAGRYSFGFLGYEDERNGLIYDPFLYTRVGAEASTLATPDWRLTLSADHTDYWFLGDDKDNDHKARERLGVLYGAEPYTVPFTPWVSYDLFSDDYFDSLYHTFYAGGSGRLSENVRFDGRFGYFWTSDKPTDREHWLWNIGLRHQINERTVHGIRVGQDFFMNEFSIDSAVSNFVHYFITHELSDRARIHGFAQWSNDEFLSGPLVGGEYDRELFGVRLSYKLSDRFSTDVGYRIEYREDTKGSGDYESSIFDANLNARIGLRTTGYLRYQHTDTDFFYEDLYMAGIRRHF